MIQFIKAAWAWLLAIDPNVPFALITIAVFATIYLVRKFAPRQWEWFATLPFPFLQSDSALLWSILSKAWQSLPGQLLGAVMAAVSSGVSIKTAILGVLSGVVAAVAHEIAKNYRGNVGKAAPKIPPALTLAFLAVLPFCVASCAALSAVVPILAEVATVATNAEAALDVVSQAADTWFISHPDAARQAAIDRAIAECRLALVAATETAQGAKDLDERQADAAFDEFRKAYADLTKLLTDAGVLRGGRFAASIDGRAPPIPQPLAMRHFGGAR